MHRLTVISYYQLIILQDVFELEYSIKNYRIMELYSYNYVIEYPKH